MHLIHRCDLCTGIYDTYNRLGECISENIDTTVISEQENINLMLQKLIDRTGEPKITVMPSYQQKQYADRTTIT